MQKYKIILINLILLIAGTIFIIGLFFGVFKVSKLYSEFICRQVINVETNE